MTGLACFIGGMIVGWVGAEIMWTLTFRARVNKANKDLADAMDEFYAVLAKFPDKKGDPK
jgi:hypothetical protein